MLRPMLFNHDDDFFYNLANTLGSADDGSPGERSLSPSGDKKEKKKKKKSKKKKNKKNKEGRSHSPTPEPGLYRRWWIHVIFDWLLSLIHSLIC